MSEMHILSGNGRCGTSDGNSGHGKNAATFNHPYGICTLPDRNGTLVVSDSQSNTLRFIQPSLSSNDLISIYSKPFVWTVPNACLLDPRGLCVVEDGKGIMICDAGHHKIKFLAFSKTAFSTDMDRYQAGTVSTFAGMGKKGYKDTLLSASLFNTPSACTLFTDGSLLVCDTGNHAIRRIAYNESNQVVVHTIAGGANLPVQTLDDQYGYMDPKVHSAVHKTDTNSMKRSGYTDGRGRQARFRSPMGMACNKKGEIIIADVFNHALRLITNRDMERSSLFHDEWVVSTIAGGKRSGHRDGACSVALFNQPTSVCFASDGSLLVAERGNSCLRQVGGISSVISKTTTYSWVRTITIDTPATSRLFPEGVEPPMNAPRGVCALSNTHAWYNGLNNCNNIVVGVADTGNNMIRVVSIETVSPSRQNTSQNASRHSPQRKQKPIRSSRPQQQGSARPQLQQRSPKPQQPRVQLQQGILSPPNFYVSNCTQVEAEVMCSPEKESNERRLSELEEENAFLKQENSSYKRLLNQVTVQLESLALLEASRHEKPSHSHHE